MPNSNLLLISIFGLTIIMPEYWEMARVTLLGSRNKASHKGSGSFQPARDIQPLAGKVVLITEAARDLGRQTAIELVKHGRPSRLYVADLPRDTEAKQALIDQINCEAFGESSDSIGSRTAACFLKLDLTSFQSIRACAAEFVAKEERLDILVLNAGIIRVATGTTKEGYEVHFGLNYLGHALLSRLLVPTMVRTARALKQPDSDVRVVVVSSEGHIILPKGGIQFEKLKTDCTAMVCYSLAI
jgi:retinol dehydrogenase 12